MEGSIPQPQSLLLVMSPQGPPLTKPGLKPEGRHLWMQLVQVSSLGCRAGQRYLEGQEGPLPRVATRESGKRSFLAKRIED